MMLTGNQIAKKLVAMGRRDRDARPCRESIAWLRKHGDKPFGWLWVNAPVDWLDWLAHTLDENGSIPDAAVSSICSARFAFNGTRFLRLSGWGASLAVLRALEAL